MTITVENDDDSAVTNLTGAVDQAALKGLLRVTFKNSSVANLLEEITAKTASMTNHAKIKSNPIGVRFGMAWFLVSQLFSMILTLFRLRLTFETDKDLEILILRQQLGILQRKQDKPINPTRAEKLTLAVLSAGGTLRNDG